MIAQDLDLFTAAIFIFLIHSLISYLCLLLTKFSKISHITPSVVFAAFPYPVECWLALAENNVDSEAYR